MAKSSGKGMPPTNLPGGTIKDGPEGLTGGPLYEGPVGNSSLGAHPVGGPEKGPSVKDPLKLIFPSRAGINHGTKKGK
jgi:hypothetical protein